MIRKLFSKIKSFFTKKKSYNLVHSYCIRPVYLSAAGKYFPCCQCKGCKKHISLYRIDKKGNWIKE